MNPHGQDKVHVSGLQ